MPKEQIYLSSTKAYIAIKISCSTGNIGTIGKPPLGGGDGTLDAKVLLIKKLHAAGVNFRSAGFTKASAGQMRRGSGTGFDGWRAFGTAAAAIAYLQLYFDVILCDGPTKLDIDFTVNGFPVSEWDKPKKQSRGIRVYDKGFAVGEVVVPELPIESASSKTAVDDCFRNLQDKLNDVLAKGRITDIFLPGGGTVPIPEWFKEWCAKNGIKIHIFEDCELTGTRDSARGQC